MKTSKHQIDRVRKQRSKGGKRPLYKPELGVANYRRAQGGPFADHPAFRACKSFYGVLIALRRMTANREAIELRIQAVKRQMDAALFVLQDEVTKLETPSDKFHFAEAIAAFFSRPKKKSDEANQKIARVCLCAEEMGHKLGRYPTKAELRLALHKEEGIRFTNDQWRSLLKRIGLSKELPTTSPANVE
jgi:hypothetical protein